MSADGLLSLATAQSNVATLTATVVVNDTHDNTAPANAFLTLTIAEPGSFIPGAVTLSLITHADGRAGDTAPGEFTGRFGDAKLCLGIHESE